MLSLQIARGDCTSKIHLIHHIFNKIHNMYGMYTKSTTFYFPVNCLFFIILCVFTHLYRKINSDGIYRKLKSTLRQNEIKIPVPITFIRNTKEKDFIFS